MCGIIGYTGHRPAVPVVVEGLRRLEYRGYDSAGVAYVQRNELHITRALGKLSALEGKLALSPVTMATTVRASRRKSSASASSRLPMKPAVSAKRVFLKSF